MRGTQLADLTGPTPSGIDEALDVVAGFDGVLAHGLGRLGEDPAAALAALSGAVAGTPLRDRVAEAVEKVVAGSVAEEHLVALAAARAAVLGAVHDALLARLDAALDHTRAGWEGPPGATGEADPALTACRAWLTEVAVAGWRGVDHDVVSAAAGALPGLLAQPRLRRLAVLFDGLVAELRAGSPVARMQRVPVRRWADLWTRALLLCQGSAAPGGAPVSGRFLALGVEIHEHGTAAQIQVHGVLESGDAPVRLVRTGVTLSKVDTITGPGLWRLLRGYPVLTGALAQHRAVEVTGLTLSVSGDLGWREDGVALAEPVDPFATARVQLRGAAAPAVPPLDRHPVRIAEPVLLEGYRAEPDGSAVQLDGHTLPVALDRLPSCGPLTPALVAGSSACLGLVRWDGGRWLLQPLAVQATVKKRTVAVHNGDWAAGITDPKIAKTDTAGDAVAVLRERAGRLLRR
jgi:hypothetical protein